MNKEKRGQSSTIGVIIAIILGIVLIIFLIWGFTTDWRTFRGTTGPYSGRSNIDTIRNACNLDCQGLKDKWCNDEKTVTYPNATTIKATCHKLTSANTISGLENCFECTTSPSNEEENNPDE